MKILGTFISERGKGGQEGGKGKNFIKSVFFCSKMIFEYFLLKAMSG